MEDATAVHGQSGSDHFVGFGNLRVSIGKDADGWYAQGLEIDHLAVGESIQAAIKNFEVSFKALVRAHLQIHETIEGMLVPAPHDRWVEAFKSGADGPFPATFSHLSVYEEKQAMNLFPKIPYAGISYVMRGGGDENAECAA